MPSFRRSLSVLLAVAALVPSLLSTSGRAAAITFGKPAKLGGGSEPHISIAPDDTVFVDAPEGTPGHSALYRGNAATMKFSPLTFSSPYNRFPGGGDSDVALASGAPNRVYFLDLWLGSNSMMASPDNGATWSNGTPVTTLPPSDRQWIAVGKRDAMGNDTLYVNYSLGAFQAFTRSTDGGTTWTTHSFIPGPAPQGARPYPLVSDGDLVATSYVSAGAMMVAISTDAGTTWTTHRASLINNITGNIQNMAMEGNDLWIVYTDYGAQVQVLHSPDLGLTWERSGYPVQITDGTGSSVFPWIAVRNGKVAVSWYEALAGSGDPNAVDAPWYVMYSELTGRDDDGYLQFSAPVIAAGPAKASGGVCTQGIGCKKDRDLGDFQTVAIDGSGRALIAFVGPGGVNVVRQN
jgi:hypothetical protein